MTTNMPRPEAIAAVNPPFRAGDPLNCERSTNSNQTSGMATIQILVARKRILPIGCSGHQSMPAAVPRVGAGRSNSRAITARLFIQF
jgi:hypothetical protein